MELSTKRITDDRTQNSRHEYSSSGVNAWLLNGLRFGTDCKINLLELNIAISSAVVMLRLIRC
jgi:hypothetical protein